MDFGVVREEGVVDLFLFWCWVCYFLDWVVVELVLFLLVKYKKSFIICFEMVKYMIGDLKDLFFKIIVRIVEYLWYVFGFELK